MDMSKISVCYINPGINLKRPISEIAEILKKTSYDIKILTPRIQKVKTRTHTRHYDSLKNIKIETYPAYTRTYGYGWPIPISYEFIKKSWKILKENDIIHMWVPFYSSSFIILLLKLLFFKKTKLILTLDTIPAYSFSLSNKIDPLFKLFYRTIGKIPFFAASYISLYAESMRKYAEKAGIPKRKIVITPTGINIDAKKSDKDIRSELDIKKGEKIVLFVGLHNHRKGIDLIYNIAQKLKDQNITFVMVGEGVEREKYIDKTDRTGLKNRFRFTGIRRDIHNFYNQADIFVLPSRGEGLAGVLMEAMIYQLPIVTSDIAGTRDLVTHMENGLLCKMEDIDCYTQSILRLLKDNDLRMHFKENGLKRIEQHFLWSNNIKTFERLYRITLNH